MRRHGPAPRLRDLIFFASHGLIDAVLSKGVLVVTTPPAVVALNFTVDRLLLADAQRVLAAHQPGATGRCRQLHCHNTPWPCQAALTAQRAAAVAQGDRPVVGRVRWTLTDAARRLPIDVPLPRLAADVLDTLFWFPAATLAAVAKRARTTVNSVQQTLAQLRRHGLVHLQAT